MRPSELLVLASKVTYKPNIQLQVMLENSRECAIICLVGKVRDAERREAEVEIKSRQVIDYQDLREFEEPDVLSIFRRAIYNFETHEIDEWFRIDGVPFTAPHYGQKEYDF